jgi:uncharacterized protein YcbK (DUF882 family)
MFLPTIFVAFSFFGRSYPAYNGLLMQISKRHHPRHMNVWAAIALVVGLLVPLDQAFSVDERRLTFYHTHTQKTLDITYAVGGQYIDSALLEINGFLADFRTGDAAVMDRELLDLIYDVRASLGSEAPFEVISAYRSPKTNEMLRSESSGVAKRSQHLLGKAIDVRLRGVRTDALRDAAIALQRGGVGYYEQSDFVHMDTGRVRRW